MSIRNMLWDIVLIFHWLDPVGYIVYEQYTVEPVLKTTCVKTTCVEGPESAILTVIHQC